MIHPATIFLILKTIEITYRLAKTHYLIYFTLCHKVSLVKLGLLENILWKKYIHFYFSAHVHVVELVFKLDTFCVLGHIMVNWQVHCVIPINLLFQM